MPPLTQEERIEHRKDVWRKWFDATADPVNGWYTGWCPLHDQDRTEPGSAEFNFSNGTFHCTATPRCHHRKGVSLQVLADSVVKRY